MQANNIEALSQGKDGFSPANTELIEMEVSYHLDTASRDFISGVLHEGDVFQVDETHFLMD